MKIELETIKNTLLENHIEPEKVEEIISQLAEEAAPEVEDVPEVDDQPTNEDLTDGSEDLPKVKYEYVIILDDKNGYLKDKEIAGWVVQQEENADAGLIIGRITDAVKDQNETAKRKKNAITTLTEAFESLKAKWLKSKNIKIKTKDLTRVIISDGKLR